MGNFMRHDANSVNCIDRNFNSNLLKLLMMKGLVS